MRNILVLLTATVLLVPPMAWAQGGNSLEGAWRPMEFRFTGPNARTISPAQPGLLLFTDDYFSATFVMSDGPRVQPDGFLATATADQLRAVWGPYLANAGTYEVEAWLLTMREQVSKNPDGMGGDNPRGQLDEFTTLAYALTPDGDTLTLMFVRNDAGPFENTPTFIFSRVE